MKSLAHSRSFTACQGFSQRNNAVSSDAFVQFPRFPGFFFSNRIFGSLYPRPFARGGFKIFVMSSKAACASSSVGGKIKAPFRAANASSSASSSSGSCSPSGSWNECKGVQFMIAVEGKEAHRIWRIVWGLGWC